VKRLFIHPNEASTTPLSVKRGFAETKRVECRRRRKLFKFRSLFELSPERATTESIDKGRGETMKRAGPRESALSSMPIDWCGRLGVGSQAKP
jgi:hypothetical protein